MKIPPATESPESPRWQGFLAYCREHSVPDETEDWEYLWGCWWRGWGGGMKEGFDLGYEVGGEEIAAK